MSRTVAEIQAEHSLKISEIMNSYLDVKDEIKATRQPEAGAHLDRLSGEQRMAALREQTLGRAREADESNLSAYTSEVERYQEEIARRRTHLKEQLFKVEDAGALARAALATDTELGVLLELAARSTNAELGRAVFVAADQRGLGNLMSSYFDNLASEAARGLYEEWPQLPDESTLQKERDDIERVVVMPKVEELMPWARTMNFALGQRS